RDVDHWFRCFHIGGLKAHVVNMESQVHELSIEVEKGPGTVYGERGRKLHDSCQHERCHLTSSAGHSQNQSSQNAWQGTGYYDFEHRFQLGRAKGQRSLTKL